MKKFTTSIMLASILAPGFAFAQTPTTAPKTTDIVCVTKAYTDKETALIGSFDAFNTSMKTALTSRKDAMIATISEADKTKKQAMRKTARESFMTTEKTARKTLRDSRQKTHESFKTALKACGAGAEKAIEGLKDITPLPKTE